MNDITSRQAGPPATDLTAWVAALALPSPATSDAARIDRIRTLEEIKSAAAAAQAREAVAFKTSQLAQQHAAGVPARDRGRGISAQIALARRESPHHGARLMGLADALVREMPCTMAALTAGAISEWRATIVTRETACLSADDRRQVDAAVASRLPSLSSRQVVAETRTHAYRLDAQSIVARSSQAVADRRVTLRPAPDTMAWLSALLPVAQGVALYSALTKEADSRRAQGDERSRGQVMADTLVERVTSQGRADRVPVEVQLLMTDKTLLAGDQTAARVQGYGPIPAPLARSILAGLDDETPTWLRRLYTDPTSGQLIAMESRRRLMPPGLRRIIDIRDEWCRTPWCGAPIRHGDHPEPVAAGGLTTEANAQGLCEACNLAKEAPGWRSRPDPVGGAGHAVTITTPTGHAYTSQPPPLPGAPPVGGSQRAIDVDAA